MKMSHLRTQLVNNGTIKPDVQMARRQSQAAAIMSRRHEINQKPIVTYKTK